MEFTVKSSGGAPVDWQALKQEILGKLDVAAEYEALGVTFTKAAPNGKGVRECFAYGRKDDRPSAFVNVHTGIYHDSGGETLNFWDFALRHGAGFGRHIEVVRAYAEKAGVDLPTVTYSSGGRIREGQYLYRDEQGNVLFAVFRYRLPTGKKSFSQHPPDGSGGWKHGTGCMDGVRLVPYRLPALVAADPDETVWIVEGEKDADRLVALGLIATCNPMGAGKWRDEFAAYFAGRRIVVIPDNDPVGLKHAITVCASLKPVAAAVTLLELPDLPAHGDVSDWLDAGGTLDELGRLAHQAPEWEPAAEGAGEATTGADPDRDATVCDLRILQSGLSWVWRLWIPNAALTLLASEPGTGKTRFCFDLARRIYHGLPWPDGSPSEIPRGGKTLWIAADNQWQEMVDIPSAFAIPDEAVLLNAPASDPYGGTSLETAEDLGALEARIRRVRPVLVFIDTITNTSDAKTQDSSDAKRQYKPLQEIAVRCQTAIICNTHLNAGGKVLGRRANEKVRVTIQMECPDPEGQWNRRKLWVPKSKDLKPPPLGVTMGGEGNDYDDSPPVPPGPRRQDGTTTGPLPAKLVECMTWLAARLARGADRVSTVRTEAEAGGFGASTLYKAKDKLQVEESADAGNRKWWALPAATAVATNGRAHADDHTPF